MSEERAQYGETETLAAQAERRAREMAKADGAPALWELYLFDAYQQVSYPSGQGEKANVFTDLRDLRAENERLRAALRPFAREADDWEESTDDDFYPAIGESGDGAWSTAPATFTVGDLRRARAALNHATPAAQQEGE